MGTAAAPAKITDRSTELWLLQIAFWGGGD